ncbi:rab11 family-interacting protein 4-like isoform X1 [Stylophora pistillata]|uniref:Rab11 family-interacting protein 4 n=1 Tax=Stylophora pistillata TaxID=50429 RepID=A0A2B4RP04_STYPI|nr:rab11 family-interacting protein 4-like isoform X1 [Stylophora pistillata]PFX17972.1 Rab11 family-interacting protein 4 [Stylophora pistillata]
MVEVNAEDVLSHLKAVFEACDQNGDGFVKTQDLLSLGQEHASVGFEEIKMLIEKLDPEGFGQISFDGFCKGIHDFLGANGDVNVNEKNSHELVEDESFPRLTISVAENDQQEDSCCERDSSYSTTSTNDYNGDDDDNFQDELQPSKFSRNRKQYSTFPPPTGPRLKHRATLPAMNVDMYSDRHSHSDTSEYQSEEGFEGFGESFSEDTAFEDSPTLERNHPYAERILRNNRRSSAAAAAFSSHHMHLYKCHSENPSRHNSFDDLMGDRALSDSEAGTSMFLLTELKRLSSQVSLLQEDHAMQTDKQNKFREENKLLCTRINALEEQLESQKVSTGKQVEEESLRYKTALTKLERENEQTLETLNRKLLQAEEEIEHLKKVEPMLRKELEICHEDKRRLLKQIDSLELQLQIKTDEVAELKGKLDTESKGRLEDHQQHEQELALASEQLSELEKYRQEVDQKLKDFQNVEQQKTDLERHVQSLIKENLGLRNSKEELNVQLQQDGFFGAEQKGSLADELVTADKEKIINALRDQEEENRRLRGYLDGLLMMIMEHNPALLELR